MLCIAASSATAAIPDQPEVTDPVGDCEFALGNEYADIVAAWVADESATHFTVHIALNKWTDDALGAFVGYTIQFEHQGVQFGVAAFFAHAFGGWEFTNGYIDLETGDMRDFREATGSFTPGEPAIISIQFDKSIFPHTDAADNQLRRFTGGSADFKLFVPSAITGAPVLVDMLPCDIVDGGNAVYEFQVGHHAHAADANDAAAAEPDDLAQPDDGAPLTTARGEADETPGFALPLLVAGVLAASRLRRRV